MSAVDLMLPRHLFMESRDQHGEVTDVIYLHDRLINWFDHGKGVSKLCDSVHEQELMRISGWEDTQLLLLEEQWLAVENGEDDDANEEQYHLACEAVSREADDRRARANEERGQRHRAIEKLVQECADHLEENATEPFVSHAAEYTIAILIIGVLAWVML